LKQPRLRPLAEADLVAAAQHYAQEGGMGLAARMFDAALAALKPIERMPAMGSPRLGQWCDIPGLRAWRVEGFPLQWLYFEADDHLDVVRLLGDRQDIAAILTAEPSGLNPPPAPDPPEYPVPPKRTGPPRGG
jgi:toxin ParE1/3/4